MKKRDLRTPIALSAVLATAMLVGSAAEVKAQSFGDLLKKEVVEAIGKGLECGVTNCRGGNAGRKPSNGNNTTVRPPRTGPKIDHAQRQRNAEVQHALNTFGFNVGRADGVLGRKSRAAISGLQGYLGWYPTGTLDAHQQAVLTDAYHRFQAGAANHPPFSHAVARDGARGFVKAVADPVYLSQVQPRIAPDPKPPVENTPPPTKDDDEYDTIIFGPKATASMAEHCDITALTTQINGAEQTAASMTASSQALDELFCEGKGYSQAQANALVANAKATEDALLAQCTRLRDTISPEARSVLAKGPQAAMARMATRNAEVGLGAPEAATNFGQLCLGLGYRGDDAEMALASALVLYGAGKAPYAEMIGHHVRVGLGTDKAPDQAGAWYSTALDALANGAEAEIAPGRTAERSAVTQVALARGSNGGVAGGAQTKIAAGEVIVPSQ